MMKTLRQLGQGGISWHFLPLHLCNCRSQDANLYLIGDLQDHCYRRQCRSPYRNTATGHNFVAVFQRCQHRLRFFPLALLRQMSIT